MIQSHNEAENNNDQTSSLNPDSADPTVGATSSKPNSSDAAVLVQNDAADCDLEQLNEGSHPRTDVLLDVGLPIESIHPSQAIAGTNNDKPESDNHSIAEWVSWKLKIWPNIIMMVTHMIVVATIIGLLAYSEKNNGFVILPEIGLSSNPISSYVESRVKQYYSLLWVSLPPFIFTVYAAVWASFVDSSSERQPYVEMR